MNLLIIVKNMASKDVASRTPQQNGVVERKNWTMKEMERIMLDESKVPNRYWKEVVQIVVYILNRAQLRVKTKYTPYEL